MNLFSLFSNLSGVFMIKMLTITNTVKKNVLHTVLTSGTCLAAWTRYLIPTCLPSCT